MDLCQSTSFGQSPQFQQHGLSFNSFFHNLFYFHKWVCFAILYYHWIFILYYFYYICRQSISQHFCLFVLYNTFGWKCQPLSFRMNIDKDLSNNGWIWMTMFYTTSRMLNLWEMMVSHHVTRKTSIVLLDFDWCFCKTRGHCCKPHCIDKYKSIYFCF